MNMYKKYLEMIGVMSETEFNELLDLFDKSVTEDFDELRIDSEFIMNPDELAESLINHYIETHLDIQSNNCYAWYVNAEPKEFELSGVDHIEDLLAIKDAFPKWSITNYDELYEVLSMENSENSIIDNIVTRLNSFSENKLNKVLEYVNKI